MFSPDNRPLKRSHLKLAWSKCSVIELLDMLVDCKENRVVSINLENELMHKRNTK